jgi:hypothetical protein
VTFCYPEKSVSVPNISKFDNTADAWDYAAKVCLRMSQRALKDPPSSAKSDSKIAEAFYEHFRTLVPHSDSDIRDFESIHTKRIKERLGNKDDKINNQEGRVSRTALSLLYGAIVCTIMSDLLSKDIPSVSGDIKIRRKSAYAIYTYYSQLLVDERAKTTWLGWFFIIYDSIRLSPGAAAKRYAEEVGGRRSLSRKQVKGKKSVVIKKLLDSVTYEPIFLRIFRKTGLLIKLNTDVSADILSRFEKFQFEVYHQQRNYRYVWVIHDKSSLYSSKDDEYFREGKKVSRYSRESKGKIHEISPSESLTYVDADDKNNNNS